MAPTLEPGYISLTLRRAPVCLGNKGTRRSCFCECSIISFKKIKKNKTLCLLSALGVLSLHLKGDCHWGTFNSLGGKKKANGKCFNIVRRRLSPGRLDLLWSIANFTFLMLVLMGIHTFIDYKKQKKNNNLKALERVPLRACMMSPTGHSYRSSFPAHSKVWVGWST